MLRRKYLYLIYIHEFGIYSVIESNLRCIQAEQFISVALLKSLKVISPSKNVINRLSTSIYNKAST